MQTPKVHPIALVAFIVIGCLYALFPPTAGAQQKYLYDDLFSVTFPDAANGWVCGRWGTVFHTADGGRSWEKQETNTSYTLSEIHFVDKNNGWAVGDEGTILHTSDGGTSWESQTCPNDFFLMDVYFHNSQKGWISTEMTTILHTRDGGETWEVQFEDMDYILKSVSFADENNGWAVGEYGYIYHTADGGETWEQQAGHFDISDLDGRIVAGTYLFDVDAVDENTAWASGIDSYVTKTNDGGKTWEEVSTGLETKTHYFSIFVPKPGTVLLAGRGISLFSTDHGNTWSEPVFDPPITYSWLYDIVSPAEGRFVTVGRQGVIYLGSLDSWHGVDY